MNNGLRLLLVPICASVFIISCLFYAQAADYPCTPVGKPLYVDKDGWAIWKALSGEVINEGFNSLPPFLRLAVDDESNPRAPVYNIYIRDNGEGLFYGFSLVIPDTLVTLWSDTTAITINYIVNRGWLWFGRRVDTLESTSYECFFASGRLPHRLIFTWDQRLFPVPNMSEALYCECAPVVFAKFSYKYKDRPDKILSLAVTGVSSYRIQEKEVSRYEKNSLAGSGPGSRPSSGHSTYPSDSNSK